MSLKAMHTVHTLNEIMKINVNNKVTETAAANLQLLAEEKGLPAAGVAMAMNGQMVPRAEWENTPVTEGADIIIIVAASGG